VGHYDDQYQAEADRISAAMAISIEGVEDHIKKARGFLQQLPTNRETALVKTKLEEAQLWLAAYNDPSLLQG
jgi:hypothetical protein